MGIHERKEREKEQRREEIIRAATTVFFEKGLQTATMDEIADAAELSKGTIYLYFKSKEDLYLAVTSVGFDILSEMFETTIAASASTVEALQKLTDTYYAFFTEHRDHFRMFQFFQSPVLHKQVSSEMLESCQAHNQRSWNLAVSLIEKGIGEGVLRDDLSSSEIAVILWSSANAIMLQIDHQNDQWKSTLGIDLAALLKKSNMLLLETILTEKGRASVHTIRTASPKRPSVHLS